MHEELNLAHKQMKKSYRYMMATADSRNFEDGRNMAGLQHGQGAKHGKSATKIGSNSSLPDPN